MTHTAAHVTRILEDINRGDETAVGRLVSAVYEELHRLACGQMAGERAGHTLQPTALVHEAFLRVFGGQDVCWENRAHFFGAAAEAMRRILVEYARRRGAQKRGGERHRVELGEMAAQPARDEPARWMSDDASENVLALDEALDRLAAVDPKKKRIVELRFFAGFSIEETAKVLGVSPRTVRRSWTYAKSWLAREMAGD